MTQTFRAPLKKCLFAKILLGMAIWGIVAFILPYYFYRDLLACLLVPAIWYGFILWQSRKLNYITVADDRLVIRGTFPWLWRKEYPYRRVEEIGIYTSSSDYLQIKAPDLSPRPIRHHVGMISPGDYPAIVRALQSRGVKLVAL